MEVKQRSGVIIAGLALFSMFFGAGDLIWPLILGGQAGDHHGYALIGLLISGVSLPLLGLIAMMLFQGDWRAFFGQMGRLPGWVLILVIQAILGPFGSLPRLITLSFATLKPYIPLWFTLPYFSLFAAILLFFFTMRRHRVVDILGIVLCPLLLICLGAILVLGMINPPEAQTMLISNKEAFFSGLNVGYNTLDLIASFIFAPLVLAYFHSKKGELTKEEKRASFKRMLKSSLLAAFLLAAMYYGLTTVSAHYTPHLAIDHLPEERLGAISQTLLGPYGAFFSCLAVALSCLTTAIPISAISATYIHEDLAKKKISLGLSAVISLGITMFMANLGFMGIAAILSPVLQILCPGLIILSIFNLLHKLYEMRTQKAPVFVAFAISTIGYFIR